MTTPATRAELAAVSVTTMGRAKHDPRTAAEYARALAEETDRSLAKDPTRWPWQHVPLRKPRWET